MNSLNVNPLNEDGEVRALAAREAPNSISLLMPTYPAGAEAQQNPIRLRNLIEAAERELIARGFSAPEARIRLADAQALLDDAAFWRGQRSGLAVYAGDDFFKAYRMPIELPELQFVGERFHIRPLLPAITENTAFYLLALSQHVVRLFRMDRWTIKQIDLPRGTPTSIDDIAIYDDTERQLQWHSRAQPVGTANIRAAMFHGHGVGTDDAQEKKLIVEYCNGVAQGVERVLATSHDPLVLAAAEPMASIYRQSNGYAGLVQERANGNPDGLRPGELHDHAWPIVNRSLEARIGAARARCEAALGTGGATCDIGRLLVAAINGQIDTLLISPTERVWGKFRPDQGDGGWRLQMHEPPQAGDDDLLDLVAARAMNSGAAILPLQQQRIPGGGPAAAIFRYGPIS